MLTLCDIVADAAVAVDVDVDCGGGCGGGMGGTGGMGGVVMLVIVGESGVAKETVDYALVSAKKVTGDWVNASTRFVV